MQKKKRRINPAKKPINTRLWVRIVCYIACPFWCLVQRARTKVDKEVRKIKGPKLILATHQSFMDFPMLLMGVMPKMVNWIVKSNKFTIFSIYTLLLGLTIIGYEVYQKIA